MIFFAEICSPIAGYDCCYYRRPPTEDRQLGVIAVRFFLEINPTWRDVFTKECRTILLVLGNLEDGEQKGWENKIKAFIHSLLDINKKENNATGTFWSDRVSKALVNNRMFKEMVNYGFYSDGSTSRLTALIFPKRFSGDYGAGIIIKYGNDDLFHEILRALRENHEAHAVSALLRLLAKRGDLEKVFAVPVKIK